jgi:hypothetical protein
MSTRGKGTLTLSDWLSIVTLMVVAGTLVVYVIQARELVTQTRMLANQMATTNHLNRASVTLEITQMMNRLSELMLEHPELRPFLYENARLPVEEPLRARVLSTAEMFIDFMATTIDHAKLFSYNYDGWLVYFCDLMDSSPALQYWWAETRHWYNPPVQRLLEEGVTPDGTPARPGQPKPAAYAPDGQAPSVPSQADHSRLGGAEEAGDERLRLRVVEGAAGEDVEVGGAPGGDEVPDHA